jgi:hypothetical protein
MIYNQTHELLAKDLHQISLSFLSTSLFQLVLEHIKSYTELIKTKFQGYRDDFVVRSLAEITLDCK